MHNWRHNGKAAQEKERGFLVKAAPNRVEVASCFFFSVGNLNHSNDPLCASERGEGRRKHKLDINVIREKKMQKSSQKRRAAPT